MHSNIRYSQRRKFARVVTCVASPFHPFEVHELAALDVVVGADGVRLDDLRSIAFAPVCETPAGGSATCTSLNLTSCVWGGRSPDVLVAHDVATASLVFTDELTLGVPWISTHKLARRVFPCLHAYDLETVARWRGWPVQYGSFPSALPSGAARDAEMTGKLLVEILEEPGLLEVAQTALLDRVDRDGTCDGPPLGGWNAIDAAVSLSRLPCKPLRSPPWPFDDQTTWLGIGIEDLRHFARFCEDGATAETARMELLHRSGEAC